MSKKNEQEMMSKFGRIMFRKPYKEYLEGVKKCSNK